MYVFEIGYWYDEMTVEWYWILDDLWMISCCVGWSISCWALVWQWVREMVSFGLNGILRGKILDKLPYE